MDKLPPMITALMRHYDPQIGRHAVLHQRQESFVLRPQVLGHLFKRGEVLRKLAEHRAMHVISQTHLHDVPDPARDRRDVRFLRSSGDPQMSELIRNDSCQAHEHSRGYWKKVASPNAFVLRFPDTAPD